MRTITPYLRTSMNFRKIIHVKLSYILAVEDLAMNLDLGVQMDMIILDFSKALDFRLHANGRNNSQHCCATMLRVEATILAVV